MSDCFGPHFISKLFLDETVSNQLSSPSLCFPFCLGLCRPVNAGGLAVHRREQVPFARREGLPWGG